MIPILVAIGIIWLFSILIIGDPDHWEAFERWGAEYVPWIGIIFILIGLFI